MEVGTAPRLRFTRCPPSYPQLRPTLVSPLLRPRRRVLALPRSATALAIPPLPPRVSRPTLALRFRAALFHATGLGASGLGASGLGAQRL